ncbi:COG4315 family predicted lipoprotein [Streptomyces sp. NPDC054949]
MSRTFRATSLAALSAAGILLVSACDGTGSTSGVAASAREDAGAAASPSAAAAGAAGLSLLSGTARQNGADPSAGDLEPAAAPAVASAARKPVARAWVQLSSGKAGALDPVVLNGAGFTLYRFDKDTTNPSKFNCSGACADTWPPYLVAKGGKVFIDGIQPSAIGFIPRDGALQVTIGGRPVYLFSKDTKPGDTNGQGVGGTWFGVTPDGRKSGRPGATGTPPVTSTTASAAPATNATFFDSANFADPAEGITGPDCKPVRFSGSLQMTGTAKIWDGPNCTGKSLLVQGDVRDLVAVGFPAVRSIRFLG